MPSTLKKEPNELFIYEQLLDGAVALYLHIPFCHTRCSYCAFNTYTEQSDLIAPYVEALIAEIHAVAPRPRLPVRSIYIGGGTPNSLTPGQIAALLAGCTTAFDCPSATEITLEVTPGTVDTTYLTALRMAGITRLSVGMQSAHPDELRLFARTHTLSDVQTNVAAAGNAGFDTINLDLIYGIPHQTLDMWRTSLDAACALDPDHMSLYSLSIEDATPLHNWIARAQQPAPDPDRAADMYELATDKLADAGYIQYEISNWAKPGHVCEHNLHVWRNQPYLGFGAGAHGYAAQTRYANTPLPANYITRLMSGSEPRSFPLSAAADEIIMLTRTDVMAETLIMGLRLVQEGISEAAFEARFGQRLETRFGTSIAHLTQLGLLERTPQQHIRLTQHARLLGNRVFAEFI